VFAGSGRANFKSRGSAGSRFGKELHTRWNVGQRTKTTRTGGDAAPAFDTAPRRRPAEVDIMLWTIILIIVILMLIGSLPTWPYSGGWGYYPSGGLGLVLVIIILVLLLR
jgi:hypothetical protein